MCAAYVLSMRGKQGHGGPHRPQFRRFYLSNSARPIFGQGPCLGDQKRQPEWNGSKTNEGAWGTSMKKEFSNFKWSMTWGPVSCPMHIELLYGPRIVDHLKFCVYAASVFPRTCFLIFQWENKYLWPQRGHCQEPFTGSAPR